MTQTKRVRVPQTTFGVWQITCARASDGNIYFDVHRRNTHIFRLFRIDLPFGFKPSMFMGGMADVTYNGLGDQLQAFQKRVEAYEEYLDKKEANEANDTSFALKG